jgi:hypothetical protein
MKPENFPGKVRYMTQDIFYPAPKGLPVPIRPQREDESVRQKILKTDWSKVCHLKEDSLVRAGALWLHGFLDESHQIVQKDSSAEGSYWHALMHRSEGDFGNSMYWFRKVGRHPVYEVLRQEVEKLEASTESAHEAQRSLLEDVQWDPQRLVDLCQKAYDGHFKDLDLLQRVAAAEYNLLMGFVLRQKAD